MVDTIKSNRDVNFNRRRCGDRSMSINEASASGLCQACDPDWRCYLKGNLRSQEKGDK